ncbi:MAG: hypothetical protein WA642_09725 [Steroidobacteraceae bacterium]
MGLIGVEHHCIPVLERELLPRKVPAGRQEPIRRRFRRHRQDDVVHQLRIPPPASLHAVPVVAQGIKVEVPIIDELRRHLLAHQPLAIVGFDLELPSPTDVLKMCCNAVRRVGTA